MLRGVAAPFDSEGGLRRLQGNLGRCVVKISAVAPEFRRIEAPARIFDSQDALLAAFKANELMGDFVAVVRWQGPLAPTACRNCTSSRRRWPPCRTAGEGRPAHRRPHVRRLRQGAGGDHVTPEAADAGALKLREGDMVHIDAEAGTMEAIVDAVGDGMPARMRRPTSPATASATAASCSR